MCLTAPSSHWGESDGDKIKLNMKIITNPKSVAVVKEYFNNKTHPLAIALYKSEDGKTAFVLNPFGGASTDTHEIKTAWEEITEEMLPRITIVEID